MYIQCLSACSSHMTNGCYAYACSGGKYKLQFFIHQHRCPWIPGPWSVLMGSWESILSHSMLNRCRNRAGAEGHRGQVPPTNFQNNSGVHVSISSIYISTSLWEPVYMLYMLEFVFCVIFVCLFVYTYWLMMNFKLWTKDGIYICAIITAGAKTFSAYRANWILWIKCDYCALVYMLPSAFVYSLLEEIVSINHSCMG